MGAGCDMNSKIEETLCNLLISERNNSILFLWIFKRSDIFEGENGGLMVAEVELASQDQTVPLSSWVGEEVTGDVRYYNSNLVNNPFSRW